MQLKEYIRKINKLHKSNNKNLLVPTDILVKYGKYFKFDANSFKGPHGPIKECYQNATKLVLSKNLTYVEGYILAHGVPVEHAWCIGPDNKVIDPTIRSGSGIIEYYGVPIPQRFLLESTLKTRRYGVLTYDNFFKLDFKHFTPMTLNKHKKIPPKK